MGNKKILVIDVEPLIEEMHGNVAAVARALSVTRSTVYARIQESPTLQKKLKDARQTMVDNAESALYNAVLDGNMTAIIFFLKTQGKDRGYTERHDVAVYLEQELNKALDKLQKVLSEDDYRNVLAALSDGPAGETET